MRLKIFAATMFTVVGVNAVVADEVSGYARVAGFGYSEPVALRQFATDWSGGISSGTAALQYVQAESGVKYRDWGVGLFWRDDGEARFSADTAQLYYLLKNKLPLEVGKRYTIDLDIEHVRSNGVRVFRAVTFDTLATLTLGASLFRTDKLISGTMKGTVTATSSKDYNFSEVTVDYFYSRDALFDREVVAPQGRGFGFDLELDATLAPALGVRLQMQNLFGNIFWKSAPFTQAQVDSNNKTYDVNGYVHVRPLLSGRVGERDYRQHLPLLVDTQLNYRLTHAIDLVGSLAYTPVKLFRSVGAAWRWSAHTDISALYTLDANMLRLSTRFEHCYVTLGSDRAVVSKAHTLAIAMGFTYPIGDF